MEIRAGVPPRTSRANAAGIYVDRVALRMASIAGSALSLSSPGQHTAPFSMGRNRGVCSIYVIAVRYTSILYLCKNSAFTSNIRRREDA